jgi:hypothetical protein
VISVYFAPGRHSQLLCAPDSFKKLSGGARRSRAGAGTIIARFNGPASGEIDRQNDFANPAKRLEVG